MIVFLLELCSCAFHLIDINGLESDASAILRYNKSCNIQNAYLVRFDNEDQNNSGVKVADYTDSLRAASDTFLSDYKESAVAIPPDLMNKRSYAFCLLHDDSTSYTRKFYLNKNGEYSLTYNFVNNEDNDMKPDDGEDILKVIDEEKTTEQPTDVNNEDVDIDGIIKVLIIMGIIALLFVLCLLGLRICQ